MRNATRATNGHQTVASGAPRRLRGQPTATGAPTPTATSASAPRWTTNAAHEGRRSGHCGS